MIRDLWVFEKDARENGYSCIAGIDEAGRGPLAGPVVAAAVVLPQVLGIEGIDDSKKLTPKKRADLFPRIQEHAIALGVGIVDAETIDRINILQAALMAMAVAVENLSVKPDHLLIDGPFPIASDLPQTPLKKGDSLSISIAAASIVAKVTRDRMMADYDNTYPDYGFSKHKGYPTKAHREAIQQFGCSPIHRRSFKGVREYIRG